MISALGSIPRPYSLSRKMPLNIFLDFRWLGIAKLPRQVSLTWTPSKTLQFMQVLLKAFKEREFRTKFLLDSKTPHFVWEVRKEIFRAL